MRLEKHDTHREFDPNAIIGVTTEVNVAFCDMCEPFDMSEGPVCTHERK